MNTLQNTISIMKTLPEADLVKIHDFTKKLSKRHELEAVDEAVGRFLPPKSREDIYRDLEISRKQIEMVQCSSAEEVFNGLEQRYGF